MLYHRHHPRSHLIEADVEFFTIGIHKQRTSVAFTIIHIMNMINVYICSLLTLTEGCWKQLAVPSSCISVKIKVPLKGKFEIVN